MLSDLSPGDKLSLKGKIFELQKKLQIIDIRNRQKEEYSYKPTLYNYDLPNRDNNVLDSINKAEIIRKQKKDMLQAAVLMQSEEGCTFAPVITNKSKRLPKQDTRPVHLRLTEKGKIYNESIEQLRTKMGKYDDNGRKLFTPAINKEPSSGSAKLNTSADSLLPTENHSKDLAEPEFSDDRRIHTAKLDSSRISERQSVTAAAADEFLYQDARDREERFRMRERELQAEIEAKAAATKMNSSSVTLLRRKAERDARLAFRSLVQVPAEQDDVDAVFCIDDVQRTVHSVYNISKWAEEALNSHISTVFSLLDNKQDGSVGRTQFLVAAAPLLLHSSVGGAMQEFASRGAAEGYAALCGASADELSHLQSFLRKVVEHAHSLSSSAAAAGASTAFKPHIYQHSYKLAQRKERKERERIEEVLAASKGRAVLAQQNVSSSGTGVEAGNEDFPPPPPPPFDEGLLAADDDNEQKRLNDSGGDTVSLGLNTSLNHHDIMYARALLKQQNLQRIAEQATAKEMKECTFRPKLIPPMPLNIVKAGAEGARSERGFIADASAGVGAGDSLRLQDLELLGGADGADGVSLLSESQYAGQFVNSPAACSQSQQQQQHDLNGSSKSVHERLYRLKDKQKSSKLLEPSKRMVEELQACTFAPQMRSSFFHKGEVGTTAPAPPTEKSLQGALKSVERMRRAHELKVRRAAEESHEHQAELLNQSYARSREIARQGVVPFKFVLDERREPNPEKAFSPGKRTDPDLIVDVKLSALKTAKISIWRGDDPFTLASSFARVYSLDAKARDLLVTVIRQSMEQNGLIVAPEVQVNSADGLGSGGVFAGEILGGTLAGNVNDVYEGVEQLDADEDYYSESSVSGSNIEEGENQSDISDEDSISSNTHQSELESENLTA